MCENAYSHTDISDVIVPDYIHYLAPDMCENAYSHMNISYIYCTWLL